MRGLCELIANALDEDHDAHVGWADGVLSITDEGPGIPEEGLILGYTTKTATQIGQFGEGKKLACLVLARSNDIGAVRCETVGYGFTPAVERRRLLGGLIPSRSAQGAEVLVYHLYRNDRARGTVITVQCPQALAEEAIGRFRALAEPGYHPPAAPGACVLTGDPGRVWIGGVLVSTMPGFHASYDLPLQDKALQNRDRTVIEAGALRDAVDAILAASEDQHVIDRFATHVLAGGGLREPEQFFSRVTHPRARAAWRTWARTHLPTKTFYTTSGNEEAALDLVDQGFTEVAARGLSARDQWAVMELLGVEVARVRQKRHYEKTRDKTTWVPDRALTAVQRTALADARGWSAGPSGCSPSTGSGCTSRARRWRARSGSTTPATVRWPCTKMRCPSDTPCSACCCTKRRTGSGTAVVARWTPVPDYGDRTRGFEQLLSEFAGLLLGYLADGATLPDPVDPPHRTPAAGGRRSRADDPAVPASRRELARLLTDRLPHALSAGGFATVNDLVASTAVHPEYWRTLISPRPAGYRRNRTKTGRGLRRTSHMSRRPCGCSSVISVSVESAVWAADCGAACGVSTAGASRSACGGIGGGSPWPQTMSSVDVDASTGRDRYRSIRQPRGGSTQVRHVSADPLHVLGEGTVPIPAQRHPRGRLMHLAVQRRRGVDNDGICQAEGGRPIRTVRADEHCGRRPSQLGDDAGLLTQLPRSGFPRCFRTLDSSPRAHPAPPPVPHQQDPRQGLVERPDLSGDRIHRPATRVLQPPASRIELGRCVGHIACRGIQRALMDTIRDHAARLTRRRAGAGQPCRRTLHTHPVQRPPAAGANETAAGAPQTEAPSDHPSPRHHPLVPAPGRGALQPTGDQIMTEEDCDNYSVGVIITDHDERLLLLTRATPPFGRAPVAGHQDQHGSADAAARAEVHEETGLTVTRLAVAIPRHWRDNVCRRRPGPRGIGHTWTIFSAEVTGTVNVDPLTALDSAWYTRTQLQHLTDRTVDHAFGLTTRTSSLPTPACNRYGSRSSPPSAWSRWTTRLPPPSPHSPMACRGPFDRPPRPAYDNATPARARSDTGRCCCCCSSPTRLHHAR